MTNKSKNEVRVELLKVVGLLWKEFVNVLKLQRWEVVEIIISQLFINDDDDDDDINSSNNTSRGRNI